MIRGLKSLVVWVGPPASGKGTYCQSSLQFLRGRGLTSEKLVASQVIKGAIAADTPAGRQMLPYFQKHQHCPAPLVVEACLTALPQLEAQVIHLDGLPRNLDQAKQLLAGLPADLKIQGVVAIDLPFEVAAQKAEGRRVCPECGLAYNQKEVELPSGLLMPRDMPDKPRCVGRAPGQCGYPQNLVSRPEDSRAKYTQRWNLFLEEEHPVIQYLESQGIPQFQVHIDGPHQHFKFERVMQQMFFQTL